jgi:choline dehydrogenase-like flavoprotein
VFKPGNAVEDRYDFVVAGAGSAVCVLANRLSENREVRVLLYEAGPPDGARQIHIPAALSRLFRSDVDWAYFTEPQEQLDDRVVFCLAARRWVVPRRSMRWYGRGASRGAGATRGRRLGDTADRPRAHSRPNVMIAERATNLLRRENPLSTWPESRKR